MSANPAYAATPRLTSITFSTANANRDGTGTIASLITGVAAGTKIEEIVVEAQGTNASGLIRVFLTIDAGTTWRLWDEILTAAITPSGSVPAFRSSRRYPNLVLPNANSQLGLAIVNAESWNGFAMGADL